jgi:hypothetical protein
MPAPHDPTGFTDDMNRVTNAAQSISDAIDNVAKYLKPPPWVGPTADQWYQEFDGWSAQVKKMLSGLPGEQQRMSNQISGVTAPTFHQPSRYV